MSERSRRRCVLRKTALPDATHYVGYVEDEETPEMIMKKFEEMERIRAAHSKRSNTPGAEGASSSAQAAAAGPSSSVASPGTGTAAAAAAEEEGPMDQEQLIAVFKATSMYNVKSILSNNEALMVNGRQQQDRGHMSDVGNNSGSEDELVAELRGFWSDDDWGKAKKTRQPRGARPGRDGRQPRARGLQRNQRTCIITQYNRDTHAFIRRRMRVVDPDAILQLRLPPPPLPRSWGKAVQPYRYHLLQQTGAATAAAAAVVDGTAAVDGAAGTGTAAAAAAAAEPQAIAARAGSLAAAGSGSTAAAAAAAAAPRGLIHQPHALPASRNCDPASSSSSGIAPGLPLPPDSCEVHVTRSITSFAFSSLRVQHYQAVLINTGWEVRQQQQQQQQQPAVGTAPLPAGRGVASWSQCSAPELPCSSSSRGRGSSSSSSSSSSVVQRLASLPIPALCPRGFLMIWANKEHLSAVVKLVSSWGYSYVENLTWVLLAPNHSILRLPYHYLQRSHITLYIFRKDGEGRDIELRHQRNPDVVFDGVRAVEGREWDVPAEVFSTIETLLPTGKGLFLELWAPTSAGRAGWTHIVEQQ